MQAWMSSGWFWWSAALTLFALEALLPGAFMLWFAFAALATAILLLFVELSISTQWIVFSVLALASGALGWRFRRRLSPQASDQPLLNRRGEQLVGRVFVLETPIVNGRGRLKIGDAFWTAEGADLPAGVRVRVVNVDGLLLRVQAAE